MTAARRQSGTLEQWKLMSRSDEAYAKMPVLAQHAAVSAFGATWAWARFGPGFRKHLAGFERRDRWDAEQWASYAERSTAAFVSTAARSVPHYRSAYTAAEHRAAQAGQLDCLPLLEKSTLRERPESLIDPERRPRKPRVFLTSGSSGTPIATSWSTDELRASMALREARSARWASTSFAHPRATFSGRMVEPDPDADGPFYRFNAVERQIYLSAFHLRPETAPAYLRAFRRHRIQWATGYAVSFALLAGFVLDAGLEPLSLRAVVTTSEKLTPEMRRRISQAFGCPVYEEYAAVENAFFASECHQGSLHVSPDAGVVEILRPDGSPADPGEAGEVVVTGLLRPTQPLIRYRIGDTAMWSGDTCLCGRGMPVIAEVCGRVEDVLVGPDGRQLVRFHGIFVGLDNVIEAQVVQEATDRFRLQVVADRRFGQRDEEEMIRRMRQRLGDVEVKVKIVERIPRTAAGKFQAVVSEIGPNSP